jgi:hypothetical protein
MILLLMKMPNGFGGEVPQQVRADILPLHVIAQRFRKLDEQIPGILVGGKFAGVSLLVPIILFLKN